MASERLTTVLSTKGQVILPKAIREERQWPAGMRLTVEAVAEAVLLRPVPVFPAAGIDALFRSMRHSGAALCVEEMQAAVAREAERRARD